MDDEENKSSDDSDSDDGNDYVDYDEDFDSDTDCWIFVKKTNEPYASMWKREVITEVLEDAGINVDWLSNVSRGMKNSNQNGWMRYNISCKSKG